ncbi:MAG: DegT/DnrJ/EryC1/StrS family aminotransferase [Pseudomonadota bacterium]|nr:DegT/DnrJ/EryC1/StrS family aminotransferase [Pseudomonadota bacterium]
MSKLAILGGNPVIPEPLALYRRIGEEEVAAVVDVVRNGELSGFVGAPVKEFDGGARVRALEAAWRSKFGVGHAVSVNSATSGLYAAVAAAGAGLGDEVIVPPYTMSATALAPAVCGATPVFADIEDTYFCIDPESVHRSLTSRTKAIIAVNLFGHPAQLHDLRALADEHGLILIEDNAQGPLASEDGTYAGTIGHIGVFSLNRHKHIQTGEGGICITDDERLALRLRLIRNHGENLIEHYGDNSLSDIVGFNYRLTELSAAVGLCQLEKADVLVAERERYAKRLSHALTGIDGFTPPACRAGCRHAYYAWPAKVNAAVLGVSRDVIARAISAEGVPVNQGYIRPLYLLPYFQQGRAPGGRSYPKGLNPVCERMYEQEELGFGICSFDLSEQLIDRVAEAFLKVLEGRDELRRLEAAA